MSEDNSVPDTSDASDPSSTSPTPDAPTVPVVVEDRGPGLPPRVVAEDKLDFDGRPFQKEGSMILGKLAEEIARVKRNPNRYPASYSNELESAWGNVRSTLMVIGDFISSYDIPASKS